MDLPDVEVVRKGLEGSDVQAVKPVHDLVLGQHAKEGDPDVAIGDASNLGWAPPTDVLDFMDVLRCRKVVDRIDVITSFN